MTRIGIIGGGQLGLMMARAAQKLNIEVTCLDPNPDAPAKSVAKHEIADFSDQEQLLRLRESVDYLTYEFENVSVDTLKNLAINVDPSTDILEISQHRIREKQTMQGLGIQTASFHEVSCRQELEEAANKLGLPFILKTCTLGYDGKGQYRVRSNADFDSIRFETNVSYVAEEFVAFDCELSQIAVRSRSGEIRFYPLSKNTHKNGILTRCEPANESLQKRFGPAAQGVTTKLLEQFSYVGVLAVEFFCIGENLLVNEIAPRVHNSGHWTEDGSVTSQFENHIRAVCGLPIGSTYPTIPVVMFNIIGTMPKLEELLKVDGCKVFGYQKAERAGRKIGHVTLLFPTDEKIAQVEALMQ